MAAAIVKGYTFGTTEQVTAAKLHSLVDSATISGILHSELAAWSDSATADTLDITKSGNGIVFDINKTGTGAGDVIDLDNAGTGDGIEVNNSSTGIGIEINNSSTGKAVDINCTANGAGIDIDNDGTATAFKVTQDGAGKAVQIDNNASGLDGIEVLHSALFVGIDLFCDGVRSASNPALKVDDSGAVQTNAGTHSLEILRGASTAGNAFFINDDSTVQPTIQIDKDSNNAGDTYAIEIASDNAGAGLGGGIHMSSFSVDEPLFLFPADAVSSLGTLTHQAACKVGSTLYYIPLYTTGS